jgi:hypothetical protein
MQIRAAGTAIFAALPFSIDLFVLPQLPLGIDL